MRDQKLSATTVAISNTSPQSVESSGDTVRSDAPIPTWRIPEIDGLRALAMLMVYACHAALFAKNPTAVVSVAGFPMDLFSIFRKGSTGVDLFMVLSGFCLFFPLCKSAKGLENWHWHLFARKRVRRIVPPYYAAIAYATLLPFVLVLLFRAVGIAAKWQPLESPSVFLAHIFFLQTLIPSAFGHINASFWSMALEVQFYLVFPLVVLMFRRYGIRVVAAIIAVSVLYRIAANLFTAGFSPLAQNLFALFFLGRWMQFAMGMGAAYLVASHRRDDVWKKPAFGTLLLLGALALYIFATGFLSDAPQSWLQTFALGAAFSAVMVGLCISKTPLRALFDNRLMRWLGYISYSLFLTHWPTLYYFSQLLEKKSHFGPTTTFAVFCVVGFPVVLTVAYVFFLCFEKPFLNAPSTARKMASQEIAT